MSAYLLDYEESGFTSLEDESLWADVEFSGVEDWGFSSGCPLFLGGIEPDEERSNAIGRSWRFEMPGTAEEVMEQVFGELEDGDWELQSFTELDLSATSWGCVAKRDASNEVLLMVLAPKILGEDKDQGLTVLLMEDRDAA